MPHFQISFSRLFKEKQGLLNDVLFHSSFLLLLLIASVYFLERVIPFDGAFYCFKIIFFQNFNIENGRVGAFYTQLLPLLGLKLGCSLETFLRLYSISFVLWNYLFGLLIYYGFRLKNLAIAFVIAQVVAYRYSFYYPVSEIHSIIGPLFIFMALLLADFNQKRLKLTQNVLIFLMILWLLKIHILSVIPILFVLGYLLISHPGKIKQSPILIALGSGLLLFVWLYLNIDKSSYEGSKIITISSIKSVVFNPESVAGLQFFKAEFHRNYYLVSAVLIGSLLYYVLSRNLLKFSFLIVSVVGFWIIIMAVNIKHDAPIVQQNYYALFGVFASIPFCLDVLPKLRFRIWYPAVFLIVFLSVFKIIKTGTFLTEQINYFTRTSENLIRLPVKERKFIIPENNIDWDQLWLDWDVLFQSLMISSLHNPQKAVTFFTPKSIDEFKDKVCCDSCAFVGVDFSPHWFKSCEMPPDFFRLEAKPYKRVCSFQDSSFLPEKFSKENLELVPDRNEYCLLHRDYRVIEVLLKNLSSDTLRSIITPQQQFYLGYRILKYDTEEFVREGRSVIEMDVYPHHSIKTGLKLNLQNLAKGKYTVEVDLIHENVRWLGLWKRFTLRIL